MEDGTDTVNCDREEELAGRIEVLDKLRSSVRELERAKRDAEKRYREQVRPPSSPSPSTSLIEHATD
jgi:hypothetical protein